MNTNTIEILIKYELTVNPSTGGRWWCKYKKAYKQIQIEIKCKYKYKYNENSKRQIEFPRCMLIHQLVADGDTDHGGEGWPQVRESGFKISSY